MPNLSATPGRYQTCKEPLVLIQLLKRDEPTHRFYGKLGHGELSEVVEADLAIRHTGIKSTADRFPLDAGLLTVCRS